MSTEPLTAAAPASQEVSNDSGMEGGSVPRSGGGRPSYGSTDARTEAGALSTESDLSGGAVSTFVRAAPSDGFRPCAMVAYGYDRCNPGATSGILFMWQEEGSTRTWLFWFWAVLASSSHPWHRLQGATRSTSPTSYGLLKARGAKLW